MGGDCSRILYFIGLQLLSLVIIPMQKSLFFTSARFFSCFVNVKSVVVLDFSELQCSCGSFPSWAHVDDVFFRCEVCVPFCGDFNITVSRNCFGHV